MHHTDKSIDTDRERNCLKFAIRQVNYIETRSFILN